MPKRHSLAHRLAGAALSRVLGPEQAAKVLGTDTTSIRRWSVEHPADDDWAVIDQLAGAMLVERLATGGIKAPRDLAVLKGIAADKVRRERIRAEREARRADAQPAEPAPNPVQEAIGALEPGRKRWLRDYLAHCIKLSRYRQDAGDAEEDADPGTDADFLAFLAWVSTATDAELHAKDAEPIDRMRPYVAGSTVYRVRVAPDVYEYVLFNAEGHRVYQGSRLPPEYDHLPVLDEARASDAEINVTPKPELPATTAPRAPERPAAPREHVPMVISADYDFTHPSWRRIE